MRAVRPAVAAGVVAMTLGLAASAQAATRDVTAGPPVERRPAGVPRDADVNAFFPRAVTVAVGDRVRWSFRGFHNVGFPARGQRPPGLVRLDPSAPVSGAVDAAGVPFWFNGQPRVDFDPRGAFPMGGNTVTGQRLVSSGLPMAEGEEEPPPFRATFRRTGTFTYVCTVHAGMRGTVRVVRRGRRIPTASAVRRA